MNSKTLEIVRSELAGHLIGRRFGKIFQLGRAEYAFDFRLDASRYVYVNVGPGEPAIFLITRRLKDLERSSGNPSPFALTLRKRLSGARVLSIERVENERILEIDLEAEDEFGHVQRERLILQLTGRSANLFLTDEHDSIIDRARDTSGDGQQIGDRHKPPSRDPAVRAEERAGPEDLAVAASPNRPSEALDAFFTERDAERKFQVLARSASAKVSAEIKKREKLIGKMHADLAGHGEAERWKRFGDLLLSNAATARRDGGAIHVIDYFDETAPEIAIEADENRSVTEAAEEYYRRYTKARNAAAEIAGRLEKITAELRGLNDQRIELDRAVEEGNANFLEQISGGKKPEPGKPGRKPAETPSGSRKFLSSDGYEILVGKKAKDNDHLTFKIAKSLDTWMHAADYPGSHVVVRNPSRKEIPHRTLHEAAQLAAFYSQGKSQVKAAVHYTQKKFVNKPKGAAPGLVSLSSFKTMLVEPQVPENVRLV